MRCNARVQQVNAIVRYQGPVVVFARTIDSRKRLLMQQALQPLTSGYFFQCLHNQMVMVYRNVTFRIDWRNLMLCRSHLVMLDLG